jgi:hypothetical protein
MRLFGYEIKRVHKGENLNGMPKKATCLHPFYKKTVEFAFEIDGKEYYQFKNLLDMPAPRYQRVNEFIREAEMRITGKELLELTGLMREAIDKGKLTDVVIFLNAIDNLTSQYLETETYYRLFTCVFFDLDEDIMDYDFDYNEDKISLFRDQPATSFFFIQPMRKYLPPIDISEKDLDIFLKQSVVNRKYLSDTKKEYIKSI